MPARRTSSIPRGADAPDRIVIAAVQPVVDGGQHPVKRVVGEPVEVQAAVYADGHDELHVQLAWQTEGQRGWSTTSMDPFAPGLDRWRAAFVPTAAGVHRFRIVAWIDELGSWSGATQRKLDAGVATGSDWAEGAAILEAAAGRLPATGRRDVADLVDRLRAGDPTVLTDRGGDDRRSARQWYQASLTLATATTSPAVVVDVERERALFSSWYELFPRSWGAGGRPGTLRDVEASIDYVADMGFDIVYLPPIHPIGTSFRKGPNNSEVAGPGDPGSPWAIGSPLGGHTAIDPGLGTIDDFRSLVATIDANGMELALDIALQCSPDHPWVTEHPEWFRHRPDGTIRYAENPPKKYQDIYPLDFEGAAWRSLWEACRDVFLHWAGEGVRVFRVDNPHTKPFAFWEWLIGEVRERHPGTIFLSEAFTRPEIMHRLATVGFTQSYSYFPWRVTKGELTEYFTELATPPSVDRFRPSSWPNTPDILAWHLMGAPREQFALRVFLAALLSPSYGIYGPAFELCDNRPAGNGKEEYLDSEKYQLRIWDRESPLSLEPLIADLNRIRVDHAALHTLRTLRFHPTDNDQLLAFSKVPHSGPGADPDDRHHAAILVVANLDAAHGQHGTVWLDGGALGIDTSRPFEVHDLLTDTTFTWSGADNYVELHPERQPGHVFRVRQA